MFEFNRFDGADEHEATEDPSSRSASKGPKKTKSGLENAILKSLIKKAKDKEGEKAAVVPTKNASARPGMHPKPPAGQTANEKKVFEKGFLNRPAGGVPGETKEERAKRKAGAKQLKKERKELMRAQQVDNSEEMDIEGSERNQTQSGFKTGFLSDTKPKTKSSFKKNTTATKNNPPSGFKSGFLNQTTDSSSAQENAMDVDLEPTETATQAVASVVTPQSNQPAESSASHLARISAQLNPAHRTSASTRAPRAGPDAEDMIGIGEEPTLSTEGADEATDRGRSKTKTSKRPADQDAADARVEDLEEQDSSNNPFIRLKDSEDGERPSWVRDNENADELKAKGRYYTKTKPVSVDGAVEDDRWRLSKALAAKLKRDGVTDFFPVQRAVIPYILHGVNAPLCYVPDMCVSAPTGSGKTFAYAIPLIQVRASPASTRCEQSIAPLPTRPSTPLPAQTYQSDLSQRPPHQPSPQSRTLY
jgi:hypothetical protein